MRIVLINPALDLHVTFGPLRRIFCLMPPINLAYLAAVLLREGHEVTIIDEHAEGLTVQETVERARTEAPAIAGLPCMTPYAPRVFEIAEALRASLPDCVRVLGGLHADYFASELLAEGKADVVVHGEGEETFSELARALSNRGDPAGVRGISYWSEGRVVRTAERPKIEPVEGIPFPAWHLFPLDRYRLFALLEIHRRATVVLGSRGCPYHCHFCSLLSMGHVRRQRSAENIFEELEWLHGTFGYRQVMFIDPVFPFSRRHGMEFCRGMIQRGIHRRVRWVTETRVDLVNPELLEAMREAGCRRIAYGFEVGDDRVLDGIGKETTTARAREATRWTKEAGMSVIGFFMIGVPGETSESLERTVRLALDLNPDFAKFNAYTPYPGTDDFERLNARNGGLSRDWKRYTTYPHRENLPVYLPPGFTADQLIRAQRAAHRRFYFRPRQVARQLIGLRTVPLSHLAQGALALLQPA